MILDYDKEGNVVGLEILNASKRMETRARLNMPSRADSPPCSRLSSDRERAATSMIVPPEDWLRSVNLEFRAQGVDVRRRPFLALDRYCKDFKVHALPFDSPAAKRIFEWFSANTKPNSYRIGSLFTGVFYYDACFWPVDILVGYGRFMPEAVDSLEACPMR